MERSGVVVRALAVSKQTRTRVRVASLLMAQGVEVHTASSANAARTKMTHKHFGLVVIDLHIGEELGSELAKDLKNLDIDTNILIIGKDADEAIKFGAFGCEYLCKPVKEKELEEIISNWDVSESSSCGD